MRRKLGNAVGWYLKSWWQPLLVGFLLLLLLGAEMLVIDLAVYQFPEWMRLLLSYSLLAVFFLFLFSLPGIFIAGIVHFHRRRIWRGVIVWLGGVPLLLGFAALLAVSLFLSFFGPSEDHFADHLKLPEHVVLAEPGPQLDSPFGDWRNAPAESFQHQVLTAPGKGARLADDAVCAIPSLAKLSGTPEGRVRLLRYLAASPDWRLYRERSGLYATRVFRTPEGKPCPRLHNYYSHFRAWNSNTGNEDGVPEDHYQFRFGLGLDGNSWINTAFRKEGPGAECEAANGVNFRWRTRFLCGGILAEIYDESDFAGRQMTAKALELAEQEFSPLLNAGEGGWRSRLPKGAIRRGAPELILRNGFQGGLYTGEVWCNPGEPGDIYLKAYEITKGTRLSKSRLEAACNECVGWSDDPNEQFCTRMDFTIYEGDWEQYYGARFEVWFKPDSGKPERKLLKKNYRIQGWQR